VTEPIERRLLLDWYKPRRADFPWRAEPDPYSVLVAEFMLQQTQVSRVVPAHAWFVGLFPSVGALASAPAADVIRAWSGLGYNRRAVALKRAAEAVVDRFGGRIPSDPAELGTLPGIGPYTAAAVASQAFGVAAAAVDTNVRRVVGRALLGAEPGACPPAAVQAAASAWLDPGDPGAWNQALMDLGRDVCRPAPACGACPIRDGCASVGTTRDHLPAAPVRRRPAAPFEGSFRQLRGRVVAALRAEAPLGLAELAEVVGESVDRVVRAVEALTADGILAADPAALTGDPSGRVALPV
jgi:A/G-specific adenine glycosylase